MMSAGENSEVDVARGTNPAGEHVEAFAFISRKSDSMGKPAQEEARGRSASPVIREMNMSSTSPPEKAGASVVRPGSRAGVSSVVAIKAVSSGGAEEFCGHTYLAADEEAEKLMPGDIVEAVRIGGVAVSVVKARQLQAELRRFFGINETLVEVQVRRVRRARARAVRVNACIVADESQPMIMQQLKKKRRQYVLRALRDPSHLVTFVDSTQETCISLQEMRSTRVTSQYAIKDGYVPYKWDKKMQQFSPSDGGVPLVFSLFLVPFVPKECSLVCSYSNVDDTVARAMTWLVASQASGVPITFLNIQTEPLLTKVSGHDASKCTVSASLRDDLSSVINTGIYGFEDYHGIDIGVVRAVRLWYVPTVSEESICLQPYKDENRLGMGIYQTDEGFCCVSTVEAGTAADRAGLRALLRVAKRARELLVITRVEEEKITPTSVSSSGSVRCYDTASISHKLAMHRRAGRALSIRVLCRRPHEAFSASPLPDHPPLGEPHQLERIGSFSFRVV